MIVTNDVLKKMLVAFLTIAQNERTRFDERNVKMVTNTTWWAERFALVSDTEDEAVNGLIKSMEWRKAYKLNDMTEEQFPQDLRDLGFITIDKVDKEGRKVFWMRMSRFKRSNKTKIVKEYTSYLFEKLDKQVSKEGIIVVVDMTVARLINVGVQYFYAIITEMQTYYPYGTKYMLLVNMPPILQPAVKLIGFSNQEFRKRILFANKEELPKYIDPEQ